MIDMNFGGYKQNLDFFTEECYDYKINERVETLDNSKGDAITSINECLESYSDFCSNVDKVYDATLRYLQKAFYNINECEESNT